jgi:hypothetical protein
MKRWLAVGAVVGAVWSLLGFAVWVVPVVRDHVYRVLGVWMEPLTVPPFITTYITFAVLGHHSRPGGWTLPVVLTVAQGALIGAGLAWGLWRCKKGRRGRG